MYIYIRSFSYPIFTVKGSTLNIFHAWKCNCYMFLSGIAVLIVRFSEPLYRSREEPNAQIEVVIDKDQTVLANPVKLRIIPLTFDEALTRGIIDSTGSESSISPANAGNLVNF